MLNDNCSISKSNYRYVVVIFKHNKTIAKVTTKLSLGRLLYKTYIKAKVYSIDNNLLTCTANSSDRYSQKKGVNSYEF